ncbi:quinoprotein dehydrogenase-associated putative ABC transporter substrate-binding protein [Pelagibius marinus]|uniref:quinoprotein dehydrogenase-associated putative ABC transporter substrate-binding protein n=1 Tax=Pelagibius marinus TaxID=2762760 RepID=UPI001872C8F4|nr:quinoprotein dehydrogenase-associated putative ABC transporter substrate-binding protein [Pelagibius marinus]
MTAALRSRFTRFCGLCLALAVTAGAAERAAAATGEVVDLSKLRVCADPGNLPYSNDQGEGFENKIAEMIARELDVPLEYTWFPQTIGFVRMTLAAKRCDLIIGVATTNELMQNTNPYYRSSYVIVHRADMELKDGGHLDDPAFATARLGIQPRTPVATLVARYGLLTRAKPYRLIVDTRLEKPARAMVEDVAKGEIDAALAWGPLAGYWVKELAPDLKITPLAPDASHERLDFRVSMGIRYNEPDWKHLLNRILEKHKAEIEAILTSYGVPLLDEQGHLLQKAGLDPAQSFAPEPEGYRMSDYRAPVPAALKGARTVDVAGLQALLAKEDALLVDVMPTQRKPEKRPADAIWRDPERDTIKGAVWLANMGFGRLDESEEAAFKAELERLAGDRNRPIVLFCEPDCWMSWNAAKRALSYGFRNIVWFPGGATAWRNAGLEGNLVTPWRP